MPRVTTTIRPSSTASMKLVVRVCWIIWTAPKRDSTSPVCRFSNHATGSRIRCANTLESHCRLRVVERCSTAHDRIAPVATWISTSRPKPTPSVTSRSRSRLTSTLSTTHCMKNGDSSKKASSVSARMKICSSDRFRPVTRPSNCLRVTFCFSVCGRKSACGVNSSTTPVKWRDTSAIERRRTPRAGSWTMAMPRLTSFRTTK